MINRGDSTKIGLCILLIAEGKHNCKIVGFYDSKWDFNYDDLSNFCNTLFSFGKIKPWVIIGLDNALKVFELEVILPGFRDS